MKFIVCVTFLFLCTSGFSPSKAVDKSEKKGKADGHKRMIKQTTQQVFNCKDNCYRKYFAGNHAPKDLYLNNPLEMSCICHKDAKGNDYFATYFDNAAGIAAYSAYVIQASDAKWIGLHPRIDVSWQKTSGITKQGTNGMYDGSSAFKIHKGHLNPALINSYDCNHQIATFTYTNAIPQSEKHNIDSWKTFEAKIANYVKHKCGPRGGNMYLITGTSNYIPSGSQIGQQAPPGAPIKLFPPSDPNGIVRPNSLWTAGCCVVPGTENVQSIAVWGNNEETYPYTVSLPLAKLERFLGTSSNSPANLFPKFPKCRLNAYTALDEQKNVIE